MIQSIVISPDRTLGDALAAELQVFEYLSIEKKIYHYPNKKELIQTIRARAPHVVFLCFEPLEGALEIARILEAETPRVQIVGFASKGDPNLLRQAMRLGIREFLEHPFDRASVRDSLIQVKTFLDQHPVEHLNTTRVFTFLPSKAGVGTSTIAANVAAALARNPDGRPLLADFDLNSGMQRFMLKLANEFSVSDAVEHALSMDENLWPPMVTNVEGVDVLHAGCLNPNLRIEPEQIRALVTFLRRHYDTLCFDLSGNLEKYSLELMNESNQILLVCTPEIPSVHLAREKMAFLRKSDLDERVSVVLTRMQKSSKFAEKDSFSEKEVEELVGVPVIRVFPNDYKAIQRSVSNGALLSKTSELGKAFTEFAEMLTERNPTRPVSNGRFQDLAAPAASLSALSRLYTERDVIYKD